ncbi:MAG TPA: prepilin-type N-terminal cleavage/methylation domain-containing protein [Candidatus Ozemobacteraceae bacterium]|nr:prepilin-type N-terminal cleavage/methylation domain-containing protein [Candidatus Ozemobacteraceae bacterium]
MKRHGFTLIELLVVISILGLLIGIAGRRHNIAFDRSRDAAVMVQLDHLRTALHQHALDNGGRFPETLEALSPAYLPKPVLTWKGSRAAGRLAYDAGTGRVSLANESGTAPDQTPDSRGRPYAEY